MFSVKFVLHLLIKLNQPDMFSKFQILILMLICYFSSVNADLCDGGVEDYSPCSCYQAVNSGILDTSITCDRVLPIEVAQVFDRVQHSQLEGSRHTIQSLR